MEPEKLHGTPPWQIKDAPELLKMIRVYLLDELVHHNGKQLNADLIGEITGSVIESVSLHV